MNDKDRIAELEAAIAAAIGALDMTYLPDADKVSRARCELSEALHKKPAFEPKPPPNCDDCGTPMHRFGGQEGDRYVSGWSCDTCGWTDDDHQPKQVFVAHEMSEAVVHQRMVHAVHAANVRAVGGMSAQ